MTVFTIGDALVVVEPAARPSDELLLEVAERASGVPTTQLRAGRLCPHCASTEHGRPQIARSDGSPLEWNVSLSRASGLHAAVASRSCVGVDLESITQIARHPVDDVLLHPAEREALNELRASDRARERARFWVAKEALVKAIATGLRSDLTGIHLTLTEHAATVESWSDARLAIERIAITFFDVTDDVVGAIALVQS